MDRSATEHRRMPISGGGRLNCWSLWSLWLSLSDHPSAQFARNHWNDAASDNKDTAIQWQLDVLPSIDPMFPSVELDDAVVHFRSGDLMISENPHFAFVKFHTYTWYIFPATQDPVPMPPTKSPIWAPIALPPDAPRTPSPTLPNVPVMPRAPPAAPRAAVAPEATVATVPVALQLLQIC
jgi:hypothetical protein